MPAAGYELLSAEKYDPLIAGLVGRMGMEETATCWLNAEAWLDLLLKDLPPLSDAERKHVEDVILPTCAIYFAMGAALGKEEAYERLVDFMSADAVRKAKRIDKVFLIPGARRIAMMAASVVASRLFGKAAGFESEIVESSSRRLRMNVTGCAYQRWCETCGAPELAVLFCDIDDYAYGDLKGLTFRRKGTIARGDERCDFDFELR